MKINFIYFVLWLILSSTLNFAGTIVIAHRGGASMAPENTRSAWQKAIEVKADYIELDIQLSSDDSLMIMHDDTINRTTNGSGLLSSFTYNQLREFDAGSWFGSEFVGEKIPTFSEALKTAKESENKIGIVAEIKTSNSKAVSKVVKMIQDFEMQSKVIISSFNFYQLTEVKSLDSTIQVQLFATASTSYLDQIDAIGGEWIGSDGTPTSFILNYAREKNISFNSWTINSSDVMKSLIDLGVDAITTDFPKTLIAIGDTTPPSDVVLNNAEVIETSIKFSWQPATDEQSGIMGYKIFRSETSDSEKYLTQVDTISNFEDQTLIENKTFYYKIKAVNNAGIESQNFSNEIYAKTDFDITKPRLLYCTSNIDTSKIYLEFSEPIKKESAENASNFSINNIEVLGAELSKDLKTIILNTQGLTDSLYELNINNISDNASNPNTIVNLITTLRNETKTKNLVAAYTLDSFEPNDNDSIIFDNSGNENNGNVKNGVKISNGILGNGLEFDGVDDFVQLSASPTFDINGSEVTISVWTKLEYLPNEMTSNFGPLFDSESDQYVLYEDKNNNELRFKVSTSVSAERPGIPGSALTKNEWINVTGVYNGSNAKIYLNGILKDTHNLTGMLKTGQTAMLGKSGTTGTPSYFKGKIDQVQIFSKALTDVEILNLFENIKREAFYIPLGVSENHSKPNNFYLRQNYPNPFNSFTTISYFLPSKSNVQLKIYDVLGRSSITLVNKIELEGNHSIHFNSDEYLLSSGVYFIQLKCDNYLQTKKMVLLQ